MTTWVLFLFLTTGMMAREMPPGQVVNTEASCNLIGDLLKEKHGDIVKGFYCAEMKAADAKKIEEGQR